jgi:arginine/lysine/histidine/glutamine transport system substrate-binding/permease protein
MNIKFKSLLRHFAGGVVAVVVLNACNPQETDRAQTTAGQENMTLIVGTEPTFPPFEFQTKDGSLQGFDIELMNAVAHVSNFEVQYESLPFDGLIPALQAGQVDVAISAITITEARQKTVSFSYPYFKAGLAITVRQDNNEIQSLQDLEKKRIAVQIGTTGARQAQEIPNAEVKTFDSAPLALQDLANGNVDAVINDAPVTLDAIANNKIQGLKIIDSLVTEEFYGIATPKNSEHLGMINEGLKTVIQNGTYEEIYQEWFESEPLELPTPLNEKL